MRRPSRTTAIRVAAMVGLVVIGRSLPAGGRAAPPGPPPHEIRPARVEIRPAPVETARAASQRILDAYASYPRIGPTEAEKSVRDLATTAAADRLAADLRADLARLAVGYAGGATQVWAGPLAIRETAVNQLVRREEVWFARVVVPPGRAPYVEWRLAVLGLVWERDRWRLDTFDESPGPRPAEMLGAPDSAVELIGRLDGFSAERS